MNLCLLASWIKRYQLDGHKLWKQIIDHKYRTQENNVFACPLVSLLPFCKGVMWALYQRISLALARWQLLCLEGEKERLKDVRGVMDHLVLQPLY
jgi:hypothetical protein